MRPKKKLGKLSLSELEKSNKVLCEFELKTILGGSGTWDCAFNSFIYFHQVNTGQTIDKNEMVSLYERYTGSNPQTAGGVQISSFIDFLSLYGYQVGSGGSYSMHMVVFPTNSGSVPYHFANYAGSVMTTDSGASYAIAWDSTQNKFIGISMSLFDSGSAGAYPLDNDYLDSDIDQGSYSNMNPSDNYNNYA